MLSAIFVVPDELCSVLPVWGGWSSIPLTDLVDCVFSSCSFVLSATDLFHCLLLWGFFFIILCLQQDAPVDLISLWSSAQFSSWFASFKSNHCCQVYLSALTFPSLRKLFIHKLQISNNAINFHQWQIHWCSTGTAVLCAHHGYSGKHLNIMVLHCSLYNGSRERFLYCWRYCLFMAPGLIPSNKLCATVRYWYLYYIHLLTAVQGKSSVGWNCSLILTSIAGESPSLGKRVSSMLDGVLLPMESQVQSLGVLQNPALDGFLDSGSHQEYIFPTAESSGQRGLWTHP